MKAEVEKIDAKLLQEQDKVNSLLKYMPSIEKNQNAEHEYLVVVSDLYDLMKSGMSILKNKDSIISRIEKLKGL